MRFLFLYRSSHPYRASSYTNVKLHSTILFRNRSSVFKSFRWFLPFLTRPSTERNIRLFTVPVFIGLVLVRTTHGSCRSVFPSVAPTLTHLCTFSPMVFIVPSLERPVTFLKLHMNTLYSALTGLYSTYCKFILVRMTT